MTTQELRVRLHGLQRRPELNGREGVVVKHDLTTQRFGVLLEGETKPLALKPDNLQPLQLPAGTRVRLMGLLSRPELNGQVGTVDSTDEALDSVDVLTDGGELVSARAEWLWLLPPRAADGGAISDEAVFEEAQCLLSAGNLELYHGGSRGAMRLYDQCLACAQRIPDTMKAKAVEASALGNLGSACSGLGQYHRAIEYHTQALAISQEIGDQQGEGTRLCNLGIAHHCLGQYARAIEYLNQALAIFKQIYEREEEGKVLGYLGLVYTDLGKYERAIERLNQALAISEEIGDRKSQGDHLGNLGRAYQSLGQYERAIALHMKGLAISEEIGHRLGEGTELANLGSIYGSLGQYERAIEYIVEALAISQEMGDQQGEGSRLGNLGAAYDSLGLHTRAIEYHTQALAILKEIGDRQGEGHRLGSLGNAYRNLGQHGNAIEHYKQALAISVEIGDRQGEGHVLYNLGLIHGEDPAAGLPWLQQSAAAFDKLWSALATDDRRVSYGETFANTGRALQLTHAALGQPEAALEAAERARSRAFEVLLAQQRLVRGAAAAGPTAKRRRVVAESLDCDALTAVAGRLGLTVVVFSQVLPRHLLAWVVRGGGKGVTMTQIEIPEDDKSLTWIVELTLCSIGARSRHGEAKVRSIPEPADKSTLPQPTVDKAALTDALSHRRRGGSCPARRRTRGPGDRGDFEMLDGDEGDAEWAEMEEEMEGLLLDVATGGAAEEQPAAEDAYDPTTNLRHYHDLLIAPLGLADGEPLLLVPDRDLYTLPFAALLDADGKHLIERHSLRVAPSVGTVIELEELAKDRVPPAEPTALVLGDPNFHDWADQLPNARVEAQRTASQLEQLGYACPDQIRLLVDDAATKAAVVAAMESSDLIHNATHGEPDGVLLSGATYAEGKLSMAEVQELELRAQLVVLSQCDSFKGKLTTDGVIGITRAFMAAGALTLVASQWKLNDVATKVLMERFYERLLAPGPSMGDVAVAMQAAMVSMIKQEGDEKWSVEEWAGFVVYGLGSLSPSEKQQLNMSPI